MVLEGCSLTWKYKLIMKRLWAKAIDTWR